jgi:hypothetical protein
MGRRGKRGRDYTNEKQTFEFQQLKLTLFQGLNYATLKN